MLEKILVVTPWTSGAPSTGTLELLQVAQRLQVPGDTCQIDVLVTGFDIEESQILLGGYGVTYVYTLPVVLDVPHADALVAAILGLPDVETTTYVLLQDEDIGREVSARLGAEWRASVITDVTDIEFTDALPIDVNTGKVADGGDDSPYAGHLFIRPVYGGKAFAKLQCTKFPAVIAVRPKNFKPLLCQLVTPVKVLQKLQVSVGNRVRFIERLEERVANHLEEAAIVISGGRGLGGPEAFAALEELANLVGGAVGASRAAVDAGWAPASYQVGQTGKMIRPELYVAIGISGAIQHLSGISHAKYVVAVNTDPDAPIFKRANVGVVEDFRNIVPLLTQKLTDLLESTAKRLQ